MLKEIALDDIDYFEAILLRDKEGCQICRDGKLYYYCGETKIVTDLQRETVIQHGFFKGIKINPAIEEGKTNGCFSVVISGDRFLLGFFGYDNPRTVSALKIGNIL